MIWGVIGLSIALYGNLFENLIQFVNIVGSVFYGTILGIFLVGFYRKHIGANATFYAAAMTQVIVICVFLMDKIPYLWLNVIGVLGVILIGELLSLFSSKDYV